jgi:hypothetical protein
MQEQDFDYGANGLNPDRYLTRRGIAEVANRVFGVPLTVEAINKAALKGCGPKIDAMAGNAQLSTTRHGVEFILGRLRSPDNAARTTATAA